jgi:hypothetical protein
MKRKISGGGGVKMGVKFEKLGNYNAIKDKTQK